MIKKTALFFICCLCTATFTASCQKTETAYDKNIINNEISSLKTPRMDFKAVVFNNKIFIAGGGNVTNRKWSLSKDIEYYDTITRKWEKAGEIKTARLSFDMILQGSSLIIAGGSDEYENPVTAVEKIDLNTGVSENMGTLTVARERLALVELKSCLYAIGGGKGEARYTIEKFDPAIGKWETCYRFRSPHHPVGAVADEQNIFILSDTISARMTGSKVLEKYNPENNSLVYLADMPANRCDAPVILHEGKIIVIGGWTPSGTTGVIETFDIKKSSWKEIGKLNITRQFHPALILNNKLVVMGGSHDLSMGCIDNVETIPLAELK